MDGYFGKILYADLSGKKTRVEAFGEDFARSYLGGNGFAARILYDLNPPGVDPFAPENAVVFAVGPWTDTPVPSASRACAASKSPLTGLFFDSTFGGAWPSTFKRAGYDALVITGRAERPTYLLVTDEGAYFRDASNLWGRWIRESCDRISEREGGADVLAIGPAGENRVRFASMAHTWRKSRDGISGRGGIAAVLGSKNLKAVAVRGKGKFLIHDEKSLREFVNGTAAQVRTGTKGLHTYGTPILVNMINALGALGSYNLQREVFEDCKPISGELMRERYLDKDTTCYKCPVACGKDYAMKEGEFAGTRWKMPEYETIFALGTMLGNANPGSLLKGNMLCDELGLDTISLGVAMSMAWECYEKGLVRKEDLGFEPRWGDYRTILKLIEDTAYRRGFGDKLAEGGKRLAEAIGGDAPKYLYAAKGLEMPAHSARALKGMSIGYATGTRGGSHHDTRPTLQYASDHDNTTPEGKPLFAIRTQHLTAVGDSLTHCRFTSERGYGGMLNENYAKMLHMVTGWDVTAEEMERMGERICNLERAYNVREGVRRKDDTLPWRVMHEPIPEGPHKGMHCPPEELNRMLDEYYSLRGWDPKTGIPTREKLTSLGLAFAAGDLKERGILTHISPLDPSDADSIA